MVLFFFFIHIFQILSLGSIIGWGHRPICLAQTTHPVIASLVEMKSKYMGSERCKVQYV
jgi:hypothetical protein